MARVLRTRASRFCSRPMGFSLVLVSTLLLASASVSAPSPALATTTLGPAWEVFPRFLPPLGNGTKPTRVLVVGALRALFASDAAPLALDVEGGVSRAARTKLALASADGKPGRDNPSPRYAQQLLNSRIVVTCNPDDWEGDSRLGEALAAGALVLTDRMADPPPILEDNTNVVFYDSVEDMLDKVRHFLTHTRTHAHTHTHTHTHPPHPYPHPHHAG
ncbi:hypothetical protein T492DRAFT_164824 [Pavlovales sp. CCMP2436]|nr:hypothetical protein T492DRAFT_164824 [Pavlovales sp. CCMP2436]